MTGGGSTGGGSTGGGSTGGGSTGGGSTGGGSVGGGSAGGGSCVTGGLSGGVRGSVPRGATENICRDSSACMHGGCRVLPRDKTRALSSLPMTVSLPVTQIFSEAA